jgi:hypothetical protein
MLFQMRHCSRYELEEACAPGRGCSGCHHSFDRHGLKLGSTVEIKYLETAQRLREGVLKKWINPKSGTIGQLTPANYSIVWKLE